LIAAVALFLRCGRDPRSIRQQRIDSKLEITMNIFWKKTIPSGFFGTTANWVQGAVPGANDVAELTTTGADVTEDTTNTVLGLNLVSTGILEIDDGFLTATEGTASGANRGTINIGFPGALTVGGIFDNIGAINVDGALNFQSFDATLKGSGTVTLKDVTGQIDIESSSKLTNVDNTIDGQGLIDGHSPLINLKNGVIDADHPFGAIVLEVPVTNSGLLEATATSAELDIEVPLNNTGGFIAASGTARVNLFSDVVGGTLTTAAGGEIIANGATLNGSGGHVVTNSGTFTVQSGAQATLTGIIDNMGLIKVASATLSVESATTIKGGGLIDLSNGGSLVAAPGAVLTNVSDLIATANGPANIGGSGWQLINGAGGLIGDALSPSAILTIDLSGSGGFVSNAGVIVAEAASLMIEGNIRNTGTGTILAEPFAIVTLENSGNIVGGTLAGSGGSFDVPNEMAFTLDGGSAVVATNKMITIHAP
jgi:fibronectin-binding autotransporter adhesin